MWKEKDEVEKAAHVDHLVIRCVTVMSIFIKTKTMKAGHNNAVCNMYYTILLQGNGF